MKTIKNITTSLLSLIAVCFLLVSCEGNTNYKWVVKNSSSSTIKVEAEVVSTSSTITKNISAGSSEIIATGDLEGGSATLIKPSGVFSSMVITNAAVDSFQKNYKLSDNWKANIDEAKKMPSQYEHEYILDVTNQDF